ncbi:protein of unknown function [Weissella hellenica]|uniref:DUF3862 domain-containing protein n=2 Tax=Weissella hellenica TaxID=46256 RepID=A0ABY0K1X6_WEIHE|nr:hypothetical protein WHE01_10980 [Weissella hellenica]SCC01144.1 protein of unknown function [Weissella hellenica]
MFILMIYLVELIKNIERSNIMKKKIITVVLGIIAIILIVTVSTHFQNSATTTQNNISSNKWTKETFDGLKIGDFDQSGKGGTTYEQIIAKYGRPNKKNKTKSGNHILTVVSWNNVAGDYTGVTLTFMSQEKSTATARLTSKTLLDAKTINLAKKWTMSTYNAVNLENSKTDEHDGDTLADLTKKYGKPAVLTIAKIGGKPQTNAVWHNTNGGASGSVSIDFSEYNTAVDKKQDKLR